MKLKVFRQSFHIQLPLNFLCCLKRPPLGRMSLYWRGKKVWSAKAFFSQQKIENRIAKNASNRPLRPFFLSIGFKLLLLSFGLLPTFFLFYFFSLLWFTVYQPPVTRDKILFYPLTKFRPMVWMKPYCDGTH